MHRELHEKGVVCISVTLDDAEDAEAIARCNDFVRRQKANFEHYLLKEEIDGWQKKLGIHGPPAVFVFGRDGKLAKAFKSLRTDENPDAKVVYPGMIEPFVRQQLHEAAGK